MNKFSYFLLAVPFYLVLTWLIFTLINYLFTFPNQLVILLTVVLVILVNMLITRVVLEHLLPPVR